MGARAAPGELEIVRAFANTYDVETGVDDIGEPDSLRTWLIENHLVEGPQEVTAGDLVRIVELREAFRTLVLANNGGPVDPEAVAVIDRYGAAARLAVRAGGGGLRLEPADGGVEGSIAHLLAVVVAAMANGSWERLKACGKEDCRWVFYDHSKNHSSRWCSMAVCGNRVKASTYRKRRRTESAESSRARHTS